MEKRNCVHMEASLSDCHVAAVEPGTFENTPCQRILNNQSSGHHWGSTVWGSILQGSRESRATDFGSGEAVSGHSGGLVGVYALGSRKNLGPPRLDLKNHSPVLEKSYRGPSTKVVQEINLSRASEKCANRASQEKHALQCERRNGQLCLQSCMYTHQ